jgi:hypothetical protein
MATIKERLSLFGAIRNKLGLPVADLDSPIILNHNNIKIGQFCELFDANLVYKIAGNNGIIFKVKASGKYEKTMALKAVTRSKKYDIKNPENVELIISMILNNFVLKMETPHINLVYCYFDAGLAQFLTLVEDDYLHRDEVEYTKFVKNHNVNNYGKNASILVSELANTDLHKLLRNETLDLEHWRVLIFQVLSALAVIHSKYPTFRHNCLCPRNILVVKCRSPVRYKVNGKNYAIPCINYLLKINDFDFASIEGIINNNKLRSKWACDQNITDEGNKYYDMHFFLNCLSNYRSKYRLNAEIADFIDRVIPKEYTEPLRYQYSKVHTSPQRILETDELFSSFRTK